MSASDEAKPAASPAASAAPTPEAMSNGNGKSVLMVKPDQLPVRIRADELPVHLFRDIADKAGQELAAIENLAGPDRRAIVRLGVFDNRSSLRIDKGLFLETVRARAIEHSRGKLLFRDDAVYPDILDERARLNRPLTETHWNGRRSRSLMASIADSQTDETRMSYRRSVGVDGQLAEATHILTGGLFQIREREADNPGHGANYFQYHFRLVDQTNGVIVWHRVFDTKIVGDLAAVEAAMQPMPVQASAKPPEGGFLQRIPF